MNDRPICWLFNGAPENFVSERSRVSLTQKDEPHNVDHGVYVSPMKVHVRIAARELLQINQQRGDRIGNGRAPGTEHPNSTFVKTLNR
jgi:hypothetical protein